MTRWTDDEKAELVRLRNERKTGSQIGKALGKTRCAIIGMLDRMGLRLMNGKRPPVDLAASIERRRRRERQYYHARKIANGRRAMLGNEGPDRPIISLSAAATPPLEPGRPRALIELTPRCCRWPINDGVPAFMFCGDPAAEGRPYCPEHVRRGYVPSRHRPMESNDG